MAQSRIEEIINELYEYVESAKTNITQSKIVIQREDIFGYLDELRLGIPDEIKRCQKIIANRENARFFMILAFLSHFPYDSALPYPPGAPCGQMQLLRKTSDHFIVKNK